MTANRVNKFLASILILWLTGLTCVFCCEPFRASQEEESCPMSGHSCCKKKAADSNAFETALFSGEKAVSCCNRSIPKSEPAQQVVPDIQQALVPFTIESDKAEFSFAGFEVKQPKTYRPLELNRGSTYLLNCVFRI